MRAKTEFECAQNDLMKFCEGTTDFICEVNTDLYPLTAVFVPNPQRSIFDAAIDENGEVGELVISVGLDTSVRSTLKFEMDAALLKKLIKSVEKIAFLYYHAFREAAGDLRARADNDADDCKNFRRMIDEINAKNTEPPVDEKEREFQERLREVLGDEEGAANE